MKRVRWGIISTANIAETQIIPAILRASNAELTAIGSSNTKKREKIVSAFDIPKSYHHYDELLHDPDVDAVYIPLPNSLHKEWIMKAAQAGKHVLCEKPITLNAKDAQEVFDFCKRNDVLLMEGLMYQFHPQHQRVQEIIRSGEIGEIQLMKASFSFLLEEKEGNIRTDPKKGGGCIYDVGCYCIHAVRNILKAEPKELIAFADIDPEYGVDVSAWAFMRMDNGVKAIIDCSFEMDFREEYEIIGTKGTIKVPQAYRPDNNGGQGLIIINKNNGQRIERIYGDQYKLEIEHFSNAILNGTELAYDGANSVKNMRVIDACFESVKTGEKVSL